jgi:hypothetical protein
MLVELDLPIVDHGLWVATTHLHVGAAVVPDRNDEIASLKAFDGIPDGCQIGAASKSFATRSNPSRSVSEAKNVDTASRRVKG